MFKIKPINKISSVGICNFDLNKYQIADDIENPDALLVRSASLHEMFFEDNLKAIARAGAGVNNIPIEKCSEKGIVVFNTPGANANAVKELVITGMLVSSRNIIPATDWVKTLKGQGDEVGKLVEKGKGQFVGPELKGKKLGVIGLGAIGILVANASKSLGMEVYGFDPYLSVDAAWGLSRDIKHSKDLKEIFENCDYITIHVPSTPETKGIINAGALSNMKAGVRILNFSRADLVVTSDILASLESGKVAAYVTDFPTDEMIGVQKIIAIPHLGASTPESEDNCADMATREIIEFLENGNIINSVNFPNVELPRATKVRVCVFHKNIPNMLSQISASFSEKGINIENMLNKSKKDVAYTILDGVCDECDEVVKKIGEIEGIIRIRVIK